MVRNINPQVLDMAHPGGGKLKDFLKEYYGGYYEFYTSWTNFNSRSECY